MKDCDWLVTCSPPAMATFSQGSPPSVKVFASLPSSEASSQSGIASLEKLQSIFCAKVGVAIVSATQAEIVFPRACQGSARQVTADGAKCRSKPALSAFGRTHRSAQDARRRAGLTRWKSCSSCGG